LLHEISFVPFFEQITVDYNPGETREVEMHDGSLIRLRKTATDYDPTNRAQAFEMLRSCQDSNELLTGLIYVNEEKQDFMTSLHLVDAPLSTLPQKETQPGPDALDEIMKSLM
jgi:2-oxoglutarate ferredoxin oxidoreductase subunit beta